MRRRSDRSAVEPPRYWRSLRERAEGVRPEPELPADVETPPGVSRRAFLQLLSASAALAGGTGCFEAPGEEILPYTRRPPDVTPGTSRWYATTMEVGGYGVGLLAESREGRPVKVEGNPAHPASLGAAGLHEQAALLDLYDPDRISEVQRSGTISTWDALRRAFAGPARRDRGRGLRVLLEPTASPLVGALLDRLRETLPEAQVHFYAPLHAHSTAWASRALFGRPLVPLARPARAAITLSLDDDFLASGPFALRHAREWAERRRILDREGRMGRLYAVASSPTPTTTAADHHLRRSATGVVVFAAAVLREVARRVAAPAELEALVEPWARHEPAPEEARAVAEDLLRHRGRALVLAGEGQVRELSLLALALNALLGGVGATLELVPPALHEADDERASLEALVADARAGEVEALAILGGNPVYDAPADLAFGEALERVPRTLALALRPSETTQRVQWVAPALHLLEAWGDARALDGTASLVQPLIRPLFGGASVADVLSLLVGEGEASTYALLRAHWQAGRDEDAWRSILRQGVVPESGFAPVGARPEWGGVREVLAAAAPLPEASTRVEVTFRRDASVYDGRFANNPWLQELPDPVTKLTWDNAAWLSPRTARRLGVRSGSWLRVTRGERALEIPAIVVPGQADDSVALHLGYGREAPLRVARGVGFDAYVLRTSEAPWVARDAAVERIDGREPYALARTQEHFRLHDRAEHVVHHETLAHFRTPRPRHHFDASLYHAPMEGSPQWGMAIDLTLCTGCSACVVACQAENNVPVVGKEGVLRSREMHWLRIDRYHSGLPDEPRAVSQPMLCQHCEMAPCEYVCPVNATVHSDDGLNEMIYNRCIGTRFCSNNCPYKVRRFNWFDYNADPPELHRMQKNPEVTVRARGVMEKCTYCVQRIRRAGIEAANEDRRLRDGEVVTACQQACPTEAIRFGDVADPDTTVSQTLRAPQTYSVLRELGTRPRTQYLARIVNENSRLHGGKGTRS